MSCTKNSAIVTTLISFLGLLSFVIVIGLDLLQSYETSAILSVYIASVIIWFLFGFISVFLWIRYYNVSQNTGYLNIG